jgi:hypothetical protein
VESGPLDSDRTGDGSIWVTLNPERRLVIGRAMSGTESREP